MSAPVLSRIAHGTKVERPARSEPRARIASMAEPSARAARMPPAPSAAEAMRKVLRFMDAPLPGSCRGGAGEAAFQKGDAGRQRDGNDEIECGDGEPHFER